MLIQFLPYREADADNDPQGGSSGKTRASDVLEQYGRDALRLAEKLADVQSDNYRLREERRGLKQEVATLKERQPAEGTRVLSKEEADEYGAYVALGKPADVKKAIDANGEASAKLAKLERDAQLRTAADAAGYKPSVLSTLAGDLDIQVEAKEGKPLVYVVKDGEKIALADYAAKEWADFLPALAQGTTQAPDINAGARGNGNAPTMSDEERKAAQRRYSATF